MNKMKMWLLVLALVACPMALQTQNVQAQTHGTMNEDGAFVPDVVAGALTPGTLSVSAAPALPAEASGKWWSGLLSTVLSALIAGLTALIAWMGRNAKQWVAQKASEASTKESAAWYSTAMYLAGIAVRFAYDKYGKDETKNEHFIKDASDYLLDRLRAIDKDIADPVKNPRMRENIEGLVRAARAELFNTLSPLAPSLAPKPV